MITENFDTITINLDCVLHVFYINSNFEFLLPTLWKLSQRSNNKTIHLVAEIQTPINIDPFYSVITLITETLNLSKEKIILFTKCRDLHHPSVTIKVLPDSKYYWFPQQVIKEVADLNFEYTQHPVLFGGLFGRPSYPRVCIAKHLDITHPTQSFVTMLASKEHFYHNILGLEEYFQEEIKWFENKQNDRNAETADNHIGELNFPRNIQTWPKIWGEYFIEISVETNYTDKWEQTEKTWKCLASGKPFILFAGAGSLDVIKSMGFQTFAPYINEEYDKEANHWKRLDMVLEEIDRIANLDEKEKMDTIENIHKIAFKNKEVCLSKYV